MNVFIVIALSLIFIAAILAVQVAILYKIKKFIMIMRQKKEAYPSAAAVCQNVLMQKYKNNCQHCKYRLSYIHISDNSEEDFYYRCKIRNAEVSLKDTCDRFKEDM